MTYRHFNNETTRSSVLKAVADTGNEAAWARFFDLYAGFIFSIARWKGLNEANADDVVQTVFADLVRLMPKCKYDRTKKRFRTYLLKLIYWRIDDKLRCSLRDKNLKERYKDANVDEHMAEKEIAELKGPSIGVDEDVKLSFVDKDFAEREWQAAALEEALRRIKPEVRPEHYAAFYASAVEGQDTETVMRLYNLSRDNLYQIRKRLTTKLQETVSVVLAEMESPAGR